MSNSQCWLWMCCANTNKIMDPQQNKHGADNVMFTLAVAALLLILSGDVECNPGPVDRLDIPHLAKVTEAVWDARTNWYHLGLQLGVTPTDLDAIKITNHGNPNECITDMLKEWLKCVNPEPTWLTLVTALKKPTVGFEQVAESLQKQYCVSPAPGLSSITCDLSPEANIATPDAGGTQFQVQHKMAQLESQFRTLRSRIYEILKNVDLNDFRYHITNMNVSVHAEHEHFIMENLLDPNATSIHNILPRLNLYWDFLNYTLLQHVIEEFGTEDLKRDMMAYVGYLKRFRKSTRLCDFIKHWPAHGQKAPVAELHTLVLKMDKSWESCTLEDLEEFKATITHKFFLPSFVLILENACEGSMLITWLIPEPVATILREELKKIEDRKFFNKHQIDSVVLDGLECYYSHVSHMKKYAAYLKEVYLSRERNELATFKLAEIKRRKLNRKYGDSFSQSSIRGDMDDIIYEKYFLREMPEFFSDEPKTVLIEGAPGVGKTTYSLQLCYSWAKGEILELYSLFVLLPLRDSQVKSAQTLPDLLYHPFTEQKHVAEIELTQGTGIALLLDGWDELDEHLRINSSVFLDLVQGHVLPKATVFVTSRPWASQAIRDSLSEDSDLHIELLTTPNIQLDRLLRDEKVSPSISHKLVEYTSSQPAIKAAMHTPITANITAEVFEWSLETGSPPPTTLSQLYTDYVLKVLQRNISMYQGTKQLNMLTSFTNLPPDVYKQFLAMCELAYHSLLELRLIYNDLPLGFVGCGLMKEVEQLYAGDGSHGSYHFLHLTVQEFLAAFYISQLPLDEQRTIVSGHVLSDHFKVVLRFLSGLTQLKFITPELTKQLLQDDEHNLKLPLFHWLFEAGYVEAVSETLSLCSIEENIKVSSRSSQHLWTPLDFYVTGFCVSLSNCAWSLSFSGTIDDLGLEMLCTGVLLNKADNCSGYIEHVRITHCNLSTKGIHWFVQLPPEILQSLKHLNLNDNELQKEALNILTKAIPKMTSLHQLQLSDNPIGNGGAVDLLNSLYVHNNSLKQLHLSFTGIGEKDSSTLKQVIQSFHLTYLDISGNDLSTISIMEGLTKNRVLQHLDIGELQCTPDSTESLSLLLQQPECQLKTLLLYSCNITTEGAITLSAGLINNQSLQKLDLSRNPIGNDGAIAIGNILSGNEYIRELNLSCCNVTSSGVIKLAVGLIDNSALIELDISHNQIGIDGAYAISKMLKENKSLEILCLDGDHSVGNDHIQDIISSLTENITLKQLWLPEVHKTETTDQRVDWLLM